MNSDLASECMREARGEHASRTVGRYEIVGHLADGGMAEILLGRLAGPSGFERIVVIKRILPHFARQKSFVDMFLDEARIAARIEHPNVVHVHELGREGDDLYLVMEYIAGESLAGVLKRLWSRGERLGFSLAAHVIAEACAGLHAAHELLGPDGKPQGLVHRDVSPQNVMVTYDGQVKVLDFGIAQAADRLTRTQTGQVKGKYEYMSPEQALGESLDRRSDIFSLGTLLYELSANRRLFKRASVPATCRAICDEPIKPPSSLVPDYPKSVEAICSRALARARNERYQSALEMRRDLQRALRTLDECAASEEELAGVMRRLFADRIAEKEEMVRSVRIGSTPSRFPEADPDPTFPDSPSEPEGRPAIPSGRRRYAWLALGSFTAAAVAAVVFAFAARAPSSMSAHATPLSPSSTPSTEGSSDPAASTATANATAPVAPVATDSAPREIFVRVDTFPAGARVLLDGRDEGTTPTKLRIAAGSKPVRLEVRKKGFTAFTQDLIPDAHKDLVLTLRPSAGPAKAPSSATPAPSFWRVP